MVGVIPALLAAVGFAVFQTVNRRALSQVDVYRGTATLLGVGALVLWTVSAATQDLGLLAAAPLRSLGLFAAAGFIHFFCGWTLLGISQVRIGAARTGIVTATMTLFGALFAALFLDEPLTPVTVTGLVVVIAGVAAVSARGGLGGAPSDQFGWGVAAGLVTAVCWASSPVLIRAGLEGLPSPLMGASIGLAASAVVYTAAVLATGGRGRRVPVEATTRRLLVAAGIAVSLSIWMQWTAFDLAPVASVLGLLQLTPILVVLLASRIGGDTLTPRGRVRVWTGAVLTVAGSLLLVLAG